MTKSEFYKALIITQKKTGQGLSGIVKVMSDCPSKITQYLNELTEEGLVEACESGGSLGHPESNIYYMPTKGYNMWKDDSGEYSRYKGKFLTNVRYYLKALPKEHIQSEGISDKQFEQKNFLNPSMKFLSENKDFITEYNKWLEINKAPLEEMINLEEDYEIVKSMIKNENLK